MYALLIWSIWHVHSHVRPVDGLRYFGFVLQLVGVTLAALGISDVRREWTPERLGLIGGIANAVRGLVAASSDTATRVRAWYLRRFRGHATIMGRTAHDSAQTHESASVEVRYAQPPPGASDSVKVDWLMNRVNMLLDEMQKHAGQIRAERVAREAAINSTLQAVDKARREAQASVADLAGGGLRLQAWGVACLLVGITLATIPAELIHGWHWLLG